jgi:hypothetical protein
MDPTPKVIEPFFDLPPKIFSFGSQDKFKVTLWDETSGLATRSSVGHWEFAGWRGTP